MIPEFIDESTQSHAERDLFKKLREDPTISDWVVLHSLGLADHPVNIEGEADFVIVAPGHGVLVLEVKGVANHNLRRDADGAWYYAPHSRPDYRGPFKQASEAKHAIRKRLLGSAASKGVPILSGVVFPNAKFSTTSPEWHDWEYVNSTQYQSRPIGELLRSMLSKGTQHLLSKEHTPYIGSNAPTIEQRDQIVRLLRPSFDVPYDFGALRKKNRDDALRFTEEQFVALDSMERNPRVIFTGPAGTGKTFLAMEAARRSAAQGKKVLFLCFNARLGKWVKSQFAATDGDITATTIHSHMRSIVANDPVPAGAMSDYWETTLPDLASNQVLELSDSPDSGLLFDVLILDEAQDLLVGNFIDFLDLSIRGGLSSGEWRIFGDFEYQNVYEGNRLSLEEFTTEWATGVTIFGLKTNCRNSPEISQWAEMLADIVPGYSDVRRPSYGIDPSIQFYSNQDEQQSLLIKTLQGLYDLGYRGNDLVVLSTVKDRDSIASTIEQSPWKERLRAETQADAGHVPYCSIHSFKGLEAEAIVVTDIKSIGQPRDKTLLYVALTRPLDRLYILAHERVKKEYLAELTNSKGGETK